jgi:NAD(P)-dependent dehydrogenase (short-subunit alcohol dehydrogenase family)
VKTGLAGRTVLVTGGNANIGRAIALAFAEEAAGVVIVGRDEAQGRRVCEQLLKQGAKDVLWQAADVTDRAQVEAVVAAVGERFGGIDVLVNNVGGNVDMDAFVGRIPRPGNGTSR